MFTKQDVIYEYDLKQCRLVKIIQQRPGSPVKNKPLIKKDHGQSGCPPDTPQKRHTTR